MLFPDVMISVHWAFINSRLTKKEDGPLRIRPQKHCFYSSSGACPSWASHLHSVTSISVNTAVKEESSGLQA